MINFRRLKIYSKLSAILLISSSSHGWSQSLPSYHEALEMTQPGELPPPIEAALAVPVGHYEFESTFATGNSVSYTGQAFRQVFVEGIKGYIGTLKSGGYNGSAEDAYLSINSYYTYSEFFDVDPACELTLGYEACLPFGAVDGQSPFSISLADTSGVALPAAEGLVYQDIQTNGKQLRNKTAGNDNPLLHGGFKGFQNTVIRGLDFAQENADFASDGLVEPEDFIQTMMKVIAARAAEGQSFSVANGSEPDQVVDQAYVTEDGLDLSQLLQKVIHGAVSFSQAAGDYLSVHLGPGKGLNASATEPYGPGTNYTQLEHHWDEAFGYFGAAKDMLSYDKNQLAAGLSIDTNGDGKIAITSEKNLGLAVNAGKRDLGSSGATDFSSDIFSAFWKGRHLISSRPEGFEDYAKAYAAIAIGEWEKLLAATVIHYINAVADEMTQHGTGDYLFTDHAKFWSEMKGFALAFQFNPNSIMSMAEFDQLHALLGDRPALAHNGDDTAAYAQSLIKARDLMQGVYGFDPAVVAVW